MLSPLASCASQPMPVALKISSLISLRNSVVRICMLSSAVKTLAKSVTLPARRAVMRSGSRLRLLAVRLPIPWTSYCSSSTGARQVLL
ncbi:hypothetical protein D3C79_773680 [compost metagenome]